MGFRRHARIGAAIMFLASGNVAVEAAGALAVGQCGAYGYAIDYPAATPARTDALGKCEGRCKVVATVKRACAALAIDGKNACGPHGWAVHTKLGAAQNGALKECYRYGGRDCVIRAFLCDGAG